MNDIAQLLLEQVTREKKEMRTRERKRIEKLVYRRMLANRPARKKNKTAKASRKKNRR